jgi:hypothetical protein
MASTPPNYQFIIQLGDALTADQEVTAIATVSQMVSVTNLNTSAVVVQVEDIPEFSKYTPGLVNEMVLPVAAGENTEVWLRGDNSFQVLPENAFTFSPFTSSGLGQLMTVQIYPQAWPAVGGNCYVSGGGNRGFMDISSVIGSPVTAIVFKNTGGITPGVSFPANSHVALHSLPTATATASGLVPTPTNTGTKWLRDDATFETIPTPTTLQQPWLINNPQNEPAITTGVAESSYSDEFDGNSLNAKWNFTGASVGTYGVSGSRWFATLNGFSGANAQIVESFSLSSGTPFQFQIYLDFTAFNAGGSSFVQAYFGLLGSSKSLCTQLGMVNDVAAIAISKGVQTTGGTNVTGEGFASNYVQGAYPKYWQFGYDSTNLYIDFSVDGFNFTQVYSEVYASGTSFGGTPVTGIVLGIYETGASSYGQVSYDFIRKTI